MPDSCYTCRRRRIQCDRSQVPCAKCQKMGLECFATRPPRWVKGVAIRGKMRGVSFEDNRDASKAGVNADAGSSSAENSRLSLSGKPINGEAL